MSRALIGRLFAVLLGTLFPLSARAIEVTENADGGPTPQAMAAIIVDEASGVAVVASSANTTINASGSPSSDPNAFGSFSSGTTAPGTLLPASNQNISGNAAYAGGLPINTGVCLCTGVMEDEPSTPTTGRGIGVLGPNNGIEAGTNPGEITTDLGTPIDQDFENFVFPDSNPGGGDATVLQFQVQITSPGFLRVSFVFGSDEHPYWEMDYNDSVGIIIDGQNIAPVNIATITENGITTPFDLSQFADCGPSLFIENNVAPGPSPLPNTPHAIPTAPNYNIEFGGFTKKLTRETPFPLAPGTYTVKIVAQDVADRLVDSAVFLGDGRLTRFSLAAGHYNGDGNGDCVVDAADYTVWRDMLGTAGNKDFCADFNRDGVVNATDFNIQTPFMNVLNHCASRFEGDADADGDVDACDEAIWQSESTTGVPFWTT